MNGTVLVGEGRPVIHAVKPTNQPLGVSTVERLSAKPVVASTVTRNPAPTPAYEFDYSKIDWPAAFREDRLKQQKLDAQSAENDLRAQFGLPSRSECNAISHAMTAAWGRVMESAKKCAELEKSIFAQMSAYHDEQRRLDSASSKLLKELS